MPKKSEIPSIEDIEDYVKDAIVSEDFSDPVFALLFDLVIEARVTKRHLFENPLTEPLFFRRYFLKWIDEAIEEKKKIEKIMNK